MTDEWVADPGIGWRILLTADLVEPPDAGSVLDRLTELFARQRWDGAAEIRHDDDLDALRARLIDAPAPVVVGVSGSALVLSAHHAWVDGLGLLDVLAAVTGRPVGPSVRGVGDRPTRGGFARTASRRLAEAAFRRPAGIASKGAAGGVGDVFAELSVPGSWRTAAVVDAAVRGVVRHNSAAGRRTRHLAVAVGAGRPAQDEEVGIADRSALIRLTDVEALSAPEIADLLRTAPLEARARAGSRAAGRIMSGGMRLLSGRLGSTLLVSHLGEVAAVGVTGLAFHPVTAGGTGVSLGAVGLHGVTTVTLRARAARWDRSGLEALLDAVVAELPDA
jgi:hypothetical protein